MRKFYSFLAMAALVLTFAACSDDEEGGNPDTPYTTMTDNVAGIYDSEISVSINGTEPIVSDYAVEIQKNSDTQINFVLNDFSISSMGQTINLGTIKLDGVEIAEVDNSYSFATTDTLSLAVFPGTDALPVPIIFNGKFVGNTIDATIDINLGSMQIVVEVNGTKRGTSGEGSGSDNNGSEEPESQPLAEMIAGNYNCDIAVELNGNPLTPSNNTVSITAVSDTTVIFTLQDFAIESEGVVITPTDENGEAKIELKDVTVTQENNLITFTASQTLMLAVFPGMEAIPVPVVASGSINGTTIDAQFDINLAETMVIAVDINGEKQ